MAHLEDGTVETFPDACRVPRKLTETTAFPLLELLADDSEKPRLVFRGEVDKRKETGRLRTRWYEGDSSGTLYTYFVISTQIEEFRDPTTTKLDSLLFTDGLIEMFSTGHSGLECDWEGEIMVTFEPPSGP